MKQMKTPDIAVVIPLYNKEATIRRALLSVVQQSVLPRQVIVVDDGSTDEGPGIVKQLAGQFHTPFSEQTMRQFSEQPDQQIVDQSASSNRGIQLITQKNGGVSRARNTGVAQTSARLICFLDADDQWEPDYLQKLTRLIQQNEGADFYSLRYRIHRNGRLEYPSIFCGDDYSGLVPDFLTAYRKGYGLIHSSAVCFKRTFFEELGGFPVDRHNGEDLYLWLLAGIHGRFAFSAELGATVYKEDLTAEVRRQEHVPYHLTYYTENLKTYPKTVQQALRLFLIKNLTLHWAAAKKEKNSWLSGILLGYAKKLSLPFGILLQMANLISADIFYYLARKRVSRRQK